MSTCCCSHPIAPRSRRQAVQPVHSKVQVSRTARRFLSSTFALPHYFIFSFKDDEFPVPYQDFTVEHTFLLSPDPEAQLRLRCRTQDSGSHFTLTSRRFHPSTKTPIETRTTLPIHAGSTLLANADPSRRCVKKRRRCFLWNGKSFRVDWIVGGPCILEGFWESGCEASLPLKISK